MGQYVGIDLHRRSTTIVRMAEDGEVLGTERFVSQPFETRPGHGRSWAGARGGARVHLWLVLGG
jgi:predicted NBD/HSP70 family sugar kinase